MVMMMVTLVMVVVVVMMMVAVGVRAMIKMTEMTELSIDCWC